MASDCGYGGPRPLAEQHVLEAWRLQRGIRRNLTSLEIALALEEAGAGLAGPAPKVKPGAVKETKPARSSATKAQR